MLACATFFFKLTCISNECLYSFCLSLFAHRCQGKEKTVTVINVYCPRADPEKPERKQFKLQFYRLLQCRAEAVLNSDRLATD